MRPCHGGVASVAWKKSLHTWSFRTASSTPEPVPQGPARRRQPPGRSARSSRIVLERLRGGLGRGGGKLYASFRCSHGVTSGMQSGLATDWRSYCSASGAGDLQAPARHELQAVRRSDLHGLRLGCVARRRGPEALPAGVRRRSWRPQGCAAFHLFWVGARRQLIGACSSSGGELLAICTCIYECGDR